MPDRTVRVRLDGDVNPFVREMAKAEASAKAFARELDTSTDRSTMFAQSLLAIAPAAIPIAGAVTPALAGMTNQLAFAAAGAGVAVVAFQGVGDALKATNEYALDPTDANLQKMRQSLSELGPAGREFVTYLQELRPEMQKLQDAAQEGLFPGMQAGLDDLMSRFPQVERIFSEIATATGDLLAEGGDNLASDRWSKFFDFLETEARPTLINLGRSLGNATEGFANLWMAFQPLSDDFSQSFLSLSRDFASWADGLDQTKGFQEFLAYIERTGPKVWDTLGSLGNALLQVVEAAAPVGEAALPVIEALADTIAAVADSDAGPVLIGAAAGISAISRAISLYNVTNGSAFAKLMGGSAFGGAARAAKDLPAASRAYLDYGAALGSVGPKVGAFASTSERLGASLKGTAKLAGGAGGLAFAMSDLDEKMGVSNTTMGAMIGSVIPGWGTAIGAATGLALDFAAGNDAINDSLNTALTMVRDNTASLEEQAAAIAAAREAVDNGPTGIAGLFGDAPLQAELTAYAMQKVTDGYIENARAAQDLRFEEAGIGHAMAGTSDFARTQTDALLQLIGARNKLADQALAARDAERAWEASIDDAAESIKKNGKTLDDTTPQGRANAASIDDMVKSWNNLDAASQQSRGGIDAARKTITGAVKAAGGGKAEIDKFAGSLKTVTSPPPIEIKLKGIAGSIEAAGALGVALGQLHDKTITIRTIRKGADAGALVGGIHTGGRLPTGFAGGGVVPGTAPTDPTEDNVFAISSLGNPLRVRSGEWIINQPQSEKNDPWLKAINNGLVLDDIFSRASIPGFAAGGRYDDFQALTQSSRLEIERQKLRIQDIASSLRETETYGKGKNKKRRKVLRGRAKTVAELELREAKAELAKMLRENAQLKNYGSEDEEKALDDAAQRIADEASEKVSVKKSAAQKFDLFSGGSAAAVDRNLARVLANSQEFLGLLGTLKAKGASPWLLEQLVEAGPTGGAIRLARQYATDQAAFDSIQSRASQIDQYTNAYAGLVGSANFLNPGAWNSGISMQPLVVRTELAGQQVELGTDGITRFVQGQIIVTLDGAAQEARFATM